MSSPKKKRDQTAGIARATKIARATGTTRATKSSERTKSRKSKDRLSHRATKRLTLRDRLSQLTYRAACRLQGAEGEQMLIRSNVFAIDPLTD